MSQGHRARARASAGLHGRARTVHTGTPGADWGAVPLNAERAPWLRWHAVARVWHTVTGYRRLQRDRWELQLRNMAKQSAKHVGKIEKIEKIWQKMAKMASEAETKILHEIGDSSAKILAKAKAIPNSCSLMLVL